MKVSEIKELKQRLQEQRSLLNRAQAEAIEKKDAARITACKERRRFQDLVDLLIIDWENRNELGVPSPCDHELEQIVLGNLLVHGNDRILQVAKLLDKEDFHLASHQVIFEAMINIAKTTDRVDLMTLSYWLEKKGELELIGGRYYLVCLHSNCLTMAHNGEYFLAELGMRRQWMKLARYILSTATDMTFDILELSPEILPIPKLKAAR